MFKTGTRCGGVIASNGSSQALVYSWSSSNSSILQITGSAAIECATPLSFEIALTVPQGLSKLTIMELHLKPETESRLQELAATTGRAPDELVEDAMTGYVAELTQVRNMLDGRYDDIKSGRVKPIYGEEAFARLRQKSQDRRGS
jgi:predicted transcriptional regulator